MKIFLGADHQGFHLKNFLKDYLHKAGYEVIDEGDEKFMPEDDAAQFAARVTSALLADNDTDSKGILLCGSGQAMCMAANRFKGIRASLIWNLEEARLARNDDDSNVLCLPARMLTKEEVPLLVETWLHTPFAGAARYVRRNKALDELV